MQKRGLSVTGAILAAMLVLPPMTVGAQAATVCQGGDTHCRERSGYGSTAKERQQIRRDTYRSPQTPPSRKCVPRTPYEIDPSTGKPYMTCQ